MLSKRKRSSQSRHEKSSKIAIPTAIAITALVVGRIIYKKYGTQIKLATGMLKSKLSQSPSERKLDKVQVAYFDNNMKQFEAALEDKAKLNEEQLSQIAYQLVEFGRKDMLAKLLQKEPTVTNMRETSAEKLPLLSLALWNNKSDIANLLLDQPNIDVHEEKKNVSITPLFIAAERYQIGLLQRILSWYKKKEQVIHAIRQIENANKFSRLPLSPEQFKAKKEKIISTIKNTSHFNL